VCSEKGSALTDYASAVRRQSGVQEYLDGPLNADLLCGNLGDLARVNKWLGGASVSWQAVQQVVRDSSLPSPRLLDVGTGAADIPLTLIKRARATGMDLEITATDIRQEIVEIARHSVRDHPVTVRLSRLEEEPDGGFDIVHSSLVLHHSDPTEAVSFLRECARVATRAVVVNDLDRGDHWFLLARVLATLTTTNPYTRHDAPLSVRRAYRPDEVVSLAARAGLREVARHWTFPRFRYALVFEHA
jgi:ubiquinone/menaquinone biosynthesis C-methylase UbiE